MTSKTPETLDTNVTFTWESKRLTLWPLPRCHGLNVCVPQNAYVEFITPQVMMLGDGDFGGWLCHESGALMNEISVLIREPGELPSPFCNVRTRGEDGCLWTRKSSADTKSASDLILNFQPRALWEIKSLFMSHPVCGVLLQQPELTETPDECVLSWARGYLSPVG